MKKYTLVYWLKNESKLFSSPRCFTTDEKDSFDQAVQVANVNGYEIEKVIIKD